MNPRHNISILSLSLLCLSRNKPARFAVRWIHTSFCAAWFCCGSAREIPTTVPGLLLGCLFWFWFSFFFNYTLPQTLVYHKEELSCLQVLSLGEGNYWQWTPGLYRPTDQQVNKQQCEQWSQRQWTGSSSEPLISWVWPESRACRVGRMRTF